MVTPFLVGVDHSGKIDHQLHQGQSNVAAGSKGSDGLFHGLGGGKQLSRGKARAKLQGSLLVGKEDRARVVAIMQQKQIAQGELQKLYRMSDYAARKTMQAAGRFSPRFYAATANLLVETDRKMKTSADEPKRLLEVLLLEIFREAENG